ncbi:MAG: helix-turn-helix domain-containing protein [Candidatus Omnitrophota bacterium]|nr:helix-turn-helix domain-containing protein [Candidatus Omnitrophota bacterium]
MGVIHKLKPEVKDYILEQKKNSPQLSCRKLARMLEKKFPVKISKSSINALFKQGGLSLPAGRRPKKGKVKTLTVSQRLLPIVLLPESVPVEQSAPAVMRESMGEISGSSLRATEGSEAIPTEIASSPAAPRNDSTAAPPFTGPLPPAEKECTGAILLKAVDALLGGSQTITQALNRQLARTDTELLLKIQLLLYLPLFADTLQDAKNKDLSGLLSCLDKKISLDILHSYLADLEQLITTPVTTNNIILDILKEVHSFKFSLLNGESFFLDSQLHTVWPAARIPTDFSTTLFNAKCYIRNLIEQDSPFVLFMAPDVDAPGKEFFSFLQGLDLINRVGFLSGKAEELEALDLKQSKRRFFVFGLWPWQFLAQRKVEKIGEFKPYYLEPIKQDAYLAEIAISLTQPIVKQSLTIKGVALKLKPADKILLAILTNLTEIKPVELAGLYLRCWPNLQEAYEDFSRKIERFTYAANPIYPLAKGDWEGQNQAPQDLGTLLNRYLRALDWYFRQYFLPLNYAKAEFSRVKGLFYGLSALHKSEKGRTDVYFKPPVADASALEYALARLNERKICLNDGSILKLERAF